MEISAKSHAKASPSVQSDKVDVIIVGAGVSGLVSANHLLDKEPTIRIKILEATSDIGGQLQETSLGEIGAKWVTNSEHHLQLLLQKLGVPTQPRQLVAPELNRCWDIDQGVLAPLVKYELNRYMNELDVKTPFYKPGTYDSCHDTTTMKSHICNRLFFDKSRKFMFNLVQLVSGVDAADISFGDFMSICYSCGGLQPLIEIYIECPETLSEVSSRSLLRALSENLKFTQILFNRKVEKISHYKEYVEVHDSQQEVHFADAVILAIPANEIVKIKMSPAAPDGHYIQPTANFEERKVITSFIASYEDGYWRSAGYSGSLLKVEPFIIGYEYRPTTYAGLIIHDASEGDAVESTVLHWLAEHFDQRMLTPIDFQSKTFELNSMNHTAFTTPWFRVIWSSSAAASTSCRGLLGGAVQSGLRAGTNTLLAVRPQTVTWQDVAVFRRPAYPSNHKAGALTYWLSSLNLYNVTFYSVVAVAAFKLVQFVARKPSIF